MAQAKNKIPFSRTHRPVDWSIEDWQVALRREYAKSQNFKFKNTGRHPVFSEFALTNPSTGRTYRVAIRSQRLGDNFCSCPDFSVNALGTCKHVEFILFRLCANSRYRNLLLAGVSLPYSEIFLRYGALFAAKAGRSLIADDMGLGKTVQAIAAAELLYREFGIQKVLIICPVSLKHQWKNEIEKFCDRSVCVIEGLSYMRGDLYQSDAFFKIINYDLVHRDLDLIAGLSPDLVILDEAQRIKNWKTRLAQSVKRIKSPYCLVLTGTPLENRLEELHSIVEFVDRYRLGPMYRFLANHQQLDPENGKVVGYRNLKAIGATLESILIRRRKSEVLKQLPERMEKNFFVSMTKEQALIHEENREIVARLVAKWNRQRFLSDADQRRLMICLQYMRMVCDSTYLIDQKTRFGRKVDELGILLNEIFEQNDSKVVIFSQWERMTSLVGEFLRRKSWTYAYLHGGVPGHKRKDLIKIFHDNPACRVFLSTDAGGVGLNLQVASTVVNLDLPWNPAILEQRIGRVHRLGQHKPVRVVNFVSEASIEENMLSVLRFKKSLFAGVLDDGMDSVLIGKFMESVEKLTAGAIAADQPQAQASPVNKESRADDVYQAICQAGVSLFKALAGGLSAGGFPKVENDPGTGKPCLKLPLPEPHAVNNALPAVESLLNALKRYATGIETS